jgi:hypothetical protein
MARIIRRNEEAFWSQEDRLPAECSQERNASHQAQQRYGHPAGFRRQVAENPNRVLRLVE